MKQAEITIIIPVYNTPEKYLRACLQSALSQTLKEIQIIAIDDGSTDNSGEVCDEIAAKDNRLTVIHTENAGVSNARNVGIENAHAPYIIFMDADDYLKSNACEKCLSVMNQNTDDIVFFKLVSGVKDSGEYERKGASFIKTMQINIIRHSDNYAGFVYGSPWGKIFRKEFLDNNNLRFTLGVKRSQDRLFMLYCLEKSSTVGLYHYSGYNYVRNEESICNKYNKNIVSILDNASNHIGKFVGLYHPNDPAFKDAMYQLHLKFAFTEMQLFYLNPQCNLGAIAMGKQLKQVFEDEPLRSSINHIDLKYCYGKAKVMFVLLKRKQHLLSVVAYKAMNVGVKLRNFLKNNLRSILRSLEWKTKS